MTIDIRAATPADVPALVAMVRRLYDESKWSSVVEEFDDDSMAANLQRMMIPETGGVVVVAVADDGEFAGMAAALIYPCFFNVAVLVGQEIVFWVDPEYGGHTGPAIINGMEAVCKGLGAKVMIQADLPRGRRDEAVTEFYRRRGYQPGENIFVKAL